MFTYFGHNCFLFETDSNIFIIDPWFSRKGAFFGSWFQQEGKGEGLGVDNKGNKLNFYFVKNKNEAARLKNPNLEYAKQIPEETEPKFIPKKTEHMISIIAAKP